MEFGLEVPIPHLERTTSWVTLHFAIATTCRSHPEYKEYYRKQSEAFWLMKSPTQVMLDNGAYEVHANDKEGTELKPMSVEELFELALEVNPQIVWAPDVLFDKEQSEHLSHAFLDLCKKENAPWQVGYIPQGKEAWEIANSAMLYGNRFDLLGLSFLNPREHVLPYLALALKEKPLHMLGLRSLDEFRTWPRMPLSYDTSKPLKAAHLGKCIENLKRGEGLLLPDTEIENLFLAQKNIWTMMRCSQCL